MQQIAAHKSPYLLFFRFLRITFTQAIFKYPAKAKNKHPQDTSPGYNHKYPSAWFQSRLLSIKKPSCVKTARWRPDQSKIPSENNFLNPFLNDFFLSLYSISSAPYFRFLNKSTPIKVKSLRPFLPINKPHPQGDRGTKITAYILSGVG